MTEKQDEGMSREEAIEMLKRDVETWNSHRGERPDWHPDLSGADLGSANLINANLSSANLINANLSNANLSGAILNRAQVSGGTLSGANLSGANLRSADLSRAYLFHATLSNATLSNANLSGANLSDADLRGAILLGANLSNADLRLANLRGASLNSTNLTDADLRGADLSSADLRDADFENADLRRCRGLRLNGEFIRNAKFSAFQREPYCVVRRTYTGPKQVLILLALVVFVLPFVSKALFWLSVNQAQTVVVDVGTRLNSYVSEHMQTRSEAAEAVRAVGQVLRDSGPTLSIQAKEHRLWHVLLGLDEHWWLVVLTSLVLIYSSVRAVVTIKVGQIREHERDSGYAPAWHEYRIYYWLHRYFLWPVFWVAMLSAAMTAWNILNTKVWLPG